MAEFDLDMGPRTHRCALQKRRCYSKTNWSAYKEFNENNLENFTDIDDSLTKIIELLKSAVMSVVIL